MALNDFTDQNIQNTYQKVVQTEGNLFADGTGSAISIIVASQTSSMTVATASYAISASHEITQEVSSSYAQTASFAHNAIYSSLTNIPGGIISGAAQINNLNLTINGGSF